MYMDPILRIEGEVGTVKQAKPFQDSDFLLTVPRRCFLSFLLINFPVHLYHTVLSVPCSLMITCWERADLLALMCLSTKYQVPHLAKDTTWESDKTQLNVTTAKRSALSQYVTIRQQ